MAKSKKWVVTTDGQHALPSITSQLKAAGFNVEEVLEAIGCITGSANSEEAAKARKIPGVTDVSPEPPTIDIGPPGAEIS